MYIPGFSNMLMRPEYQGGLTLGDFAEARGTGASTQRVQLPSFQPVTPPVRQAPVARTPSPTIVTGGLTLGDLAEARGTGASTQRVQAEAAQRAQAEAAQRAQAEAAQRAAAQRAQAEAAQRAQAEAAQRAQAEAAQRAQAEAAQRAAAQRAQAEAAQRAAANPPPSVQPSAPPVMAAPTAVAAQLPGSFPGQQSEAQSDFQLSDEMLRNALRTMPGAARPDFNAVYTKPSLNPSLDYRTLGDQQGYYFTTNAGRAAKTKASPSGFVALNPEAQYRLINERGKNQVVASGLGEAGLQSAYQTAQQLSAEQGKKADWKLEVFDPSVGKWVVKADDDPKGNILGKIAGVALPIGAAILTAGASIPVQMAAGAAASGLGALAAGRDPLKGAVIGGLTAGAGAAGGKLGAAGKLGSIGPKTGTIIGSGLGATGGGLATGQSLEQALKGGALSAAGTFGGQQLGSGLRDLGVEIPGFNVAKNFTPGGPIVVTPTGGASIPVSTGLGGGGGQPKTPTAEPDAGGIDGAYDSYIEAIGNRVQFGGLPFFGAALPGVIPEGVPTTPEEVARRQADQEEGQIDVVRNRLVSNMAGGAPSFAPVPGAPLLPPSLPQAVLDSVRQEAPQEGEIIVSGSRVPNVPVAVPVAPDLIYGGPGGELSEIIAARQKAAGGEQLSADELDLIIGSGAGQSAEGVLETGKVPEEKSLGDKLKDRLSNLGVTDYMRLAALGIGLLGGGGGGNRGALGTIPGGFGSGFAPVFGGGGLPAPTLPGATGNFAPRTAADLRPQTTQDWYRYGYGPEQSFFDYVPEGEENKSQAFTGYAFGGEVGDLTGGLGMGGGSYAVNGPGTGRSDEIPALLSDGEYVMDAETVALLGDGSSKAGAERLDQFRMNVRRDKGRNLAKGEFSVNAKRPEQYLKGGRV